LCAGSGDRIPGIWFHANTRRFYLRDGDTANGNNGCDPEEQLPADVPTAVRLEIRANSVELFFNDVSKCQSDRAERTTHQAAHVWASDPWHTPANAAIADFYILCDSDVAADGLQPGDQPGCAVTAPPPPPATSADAQAEIAAAGAVPGALYLIRAEQALSQGNELQQVDIPLDYDIGFTINPAEETIDGWGNIIHVSASGENCCDYVRLTEMLRKPLPSFLCHVPLTMCHICPAQGDRIPAIWMYANSHRLHVRDGSTTNGNDGCDPTEELIPGRQTAVRLEIRATSTELFFNGVSKCQSDRDIDMRTTHSAVHVWASDPWHTPANAMISNFYMVCDNDIAQDGLQGGATCAAQGVEVTPGGGH
jgi:hypothetical protein